MEGARLRNLVDVWKRECFSLLLNYFFGNIMMETSTKLKTKNQNGVNDFNECT